MNTMYEVIDHILYGKQIDIRNAILLLHILRSFVIFEKIKFVEFKFNFLHYHI